MALNKTFTGSIIDKDGVGIAGIDVSAYHYESNVWKTTYNTGSESQYSVNGGDGDWLTQTGSMSSGDTVLLKLETTEVDPLDRQFALLEVTMDSSDVYVNDIQLLNCQPPNVTGLWSVSSAVDGDSTFDNTAVGGLVTTYVGRINAVETALTNFNDNYSFPYDGNLMLHVESHFGQDIFNDRLGVTEIAFDWVSSGTHTVDDYTHTYTTVSDTMEDDTTVEVKVTNSKGQIVTDILAMQIRYNTPVPDVVWTPNNPTVIDVFTVTGAVSDVDSRITDIHWQFDEVTVANNTTLDYNWIQDLGDTYIETRKISADITWDDGFNSHTIAYEEIVSTENQAPIFTVDVTTNGDENDNDKTFTPVGLTDPDGDDANLELRWEIYYKTPFDNLWKLVQDNGYPSTPNLGAKQWIFTVSGDYKVISIAKDGSGLETEVESLISFNTLVGGGANSGRIKLNNNVWQLIAIPVEGQNINDYFLNNVEAQIQIYDDTKDIEDVIEVVNAYPGHLDKFLSYVPGVTSTASENNFTLTVDDGSVKEVVGFWVKTKDYKLITGGDDIIFEWDQSD